MKNFASLYPSATRRNDSNTHNVLFSQKALFFFFLKQEESADIVNIASCLYKPKTSKHETWKNRTMYTTQTHGAHNT